MTAGRFFDLDAGVERAPAFMLLGVWARPRRGAECLHQLVEHVIRSDPPVRPQRAAADVYGRQVRHCAAGERLSQRIPVIALHSDVIASTSRATSFRAGVPKRSIKAEPGPGMHPAAEVRQGSSAKKARSLFPRDRPDN